MNNEPSLKSCPRCGQTVAEPFHTCVKASDTPRTDALVSKTHTSAFWWPDFARTLERELAAAETHVRICREVLVELEQLRNPHKTLAREVTDMETGEKMPIAIWIVEARKARAELATLKLAMERVLSCISTRTNDAGVHNLIHEARSKLDTP